MICVLGDTLLDVIVELAAPLVADDDVPARTTLSPGGQGANVASWVAALGEPATLVTRLGDDRTGQWLRAELEARGVTVRAPVRPGRTGTVVSMVGEGGTRTMASDRGDSADLRAEDLNRAWFAGCEWLHLSGYALLEPAGAAAALRGAALAAAAGARVSADLSSVTLVETLGTAGVGERLAAAGVRLVFANEAEAAAAGDLDVEEVVVKRGAAGAEHRRRGGARTVYPSRRVEARDPTAAGDAFAAGWLAGGPDRALDAAARCVAAVGVGPHPGARPHR